MAQRAEESDAYRMEALARALAVLPEEEAARWRGVIEADEALQEGEGGQQVGQGGEGEGGVSAAYLAMQPPRREGGALAGIL